MRFTAVEQRLSGQVKGSKVIVYKSVGSIYHREASVNNDIKYNYQLECTSIEFYAALCIIMLLLFVIS